MRLLKRLFIGICVLLLLLVGGSFLLPQQQHVERSISLSAPAAAVYPYLSNPKKFSEWSPWSKIDPNMKVEYSGPASGKGAQMKWVSKLPTVGEGSWTIVKAAENESVNVDMDFGQQGVAKSSFTLKPQGDKTQVTWGFDTDAGMNPVLRWVGLFMDKMIGAEYEKGLQDLKAVIEKQ